MAKRNDNIAPYERRQARRWTRVTDYVPDADAHVGPVHWPKPGTLHPWDRGVADERRRKSSRGLWLPVVAVAAAAVLAVWGSGVGDRDPAQGSAALAGASVSSGLVFGLCEQGGLTNCAASGDSFYLGGKTVRIADIEAPRLYGAACAREARLGRSAANHLRALLNSGEIKLARVPRNPDGFGFLLRRVSVEGRDVGRAMTAAGFARSIGDRSRKWCG